MIKKDIESNNEYMLAGNVWVRNFTKSNVSPVNISPLIDTKDYNLIMDNEGKNTGLQIANISEEKITFRHIVIISDGYDFKQKHRMLLDLPEHVAVLAVNRALAKWELLSGKERRPINLYVANNPYQQCMGYLPDRYYPTCVVSSRTHHEFVRRYKGRKYMYEPTMARNFGLPRSAIYYVDDYRNPICAAIGLSHQFGVRKLMLMCCDDSFKDNREAAVPLENGLYTYPQHLRTQQIIDGNLHWLTHQEDVEVQVRDHSSGAKYTNAAYIAADEVLDFFGNQAKEPAKVQDREEK